MSEDDVLQQMLLQRRGIADDKGNITIKPFYYNLGGKKTRKNKSNKHKLNKKRRTRKNKKSKSKKTNR